MSSFKHVTISTFPHGHWNFLRVTLILAELWLLLSVGTTDSLSLLEDAETTEASDNSNMAAAMLSTEPAADIRTRTTPSESSSRARTTPNLPQRIFHSGKKSTENSDLEFFHFKCQVSLETLNRVLEIAERLRQNVTMTLLSHNPEEETDNPNELSQEDRLDSQLLFLQQQFIQNERAIGEFRALYEEKARQLRIFRRNLGRALTRRFPPFQISEAEDLAQAHTSSCGGLLSVRAYDPTYLNFTNNGEETCTWVLFNPYRYYFEMIVTSADIPLLNPDALTLHTNFITTLDAEVRILKAEDIGKVLYVSSPAVLTLSKHKGTSRRRQAFQIQVLGSDRYASVKAVNLHTLSVPLVSSSVPALLNKVAEFDEGGEGGGDEISRKFSYPIDGAKYKNDEETFFVLLPRTMSKIKLSILTVDMETGVDRWFDYLNVYKFSRTKTTFEFFGRHTGLSVVGDWRYEGEANEPILLYFHSDGVGTRSGFTMSFSNQRV